MSFITSKAEKKNTTESVQHNGSDHSEVNSLVLEAERGAIYSVLQWFLKVDFKKQGSLT